MCTLYSVAYPPLDGCKLCMRECACADQLGAVLGPVPRLVGAGHAGAACAPARVPHPQHNTDLPHLRRSRPPALGGVIICIIDRIGSDGVCE